MIVQNNNNLNAHNFQVIYLIFTHTHNKGTQNSSVCTARGLRGRERLQDLPRASMRCLECLAASLILKIHHSFLEAAAVCLFSDTYRASKIISIEDNNLSSPVGTKLGHKCLSWSVFTEDSW